MLKSFKDEKIGFAKHAVFKQCAHEDFFFRHISKYLFKYFSKKVIFILFRVEKSIKNEKL
jgi:hypothetical protein